MKTKTLSLLLAVIMLLPAAYASAADAYTLSEKIGLQMNDGSGLKGNVTLSALISPQRLSSSIKVISSPNTLEMFALLISSMIIT